MERINKVNLIVSNSLFTRANCVAMQPWSVYDPCHCLSYTNIASRKRVHEHESKPKWRKFLPFSACFHYNGKCINSWSSIFDEDKNIHLCKNAQLNIITFGHTQFSKAFKASAEGLAVRCVQLSSIQVNSNRLELRYIHTYPHYCFTA